MQDDNRKTKTKVDFINMFLTKEQRELRLKNLRKWLGMNNEETKPKVTKTKIKLIDIEKCPYWDSDDACWDCPRFDKEDGRKEICPFHKDQTFESQKRALWLLDKIHLNAEFGKLTKAIEKVSQPIKDLAEFIHIVYLELAIIHGWKVQYNTDCDFKDLPLSNQKIMFELAAKIYEYMSG